MGRALRFLSRSAIVHVVHDNPHRRFFWMLLEKRCLGWVIAVPILERLYFFGIFFCCGNISPRPEALSFRMMRGHLSRHPGHPVALGSDVFLWGKPGKHRFIILTCVVNSS